MIDLCVSKRIGYGYLVKGVAEFIITMFGSLFITATTVVGIMVPTFGFLQFPKNFLQRRLTQILFAFGVELEFTFWAFFRDISVSLQIFDKIADTILVARQPVLTVNFRKP